MSIIVNKYIRKGALSIPVYLYAYVYSTDDVYRITGAEPIDAFIRRQTLKWIGLVARMENYMPQNQMLFARNQRKYAQDRWARLEKQTGVDKLQLRKSMMNKDHLHRWCNQGSLAAPNG